MSFVKDLLRVHLRTLSPYTSARDEYTGSDGIFLDANENPYGSAAGNGWNRYPDPYQQQLKNRISEIKDVDPSLLFLGNGSDEPIDLLIRAFCEPGIDKIGIFLPTYGMYKVSADIQNVGISVHHLTDTFQLDIPSFEREVQSNEKIIFVCSPNNPTGNHLLPEDIEQILSTAPGLVVIDEAYIDFSPDSTFVKELSKYENLVVLQTFSKAWGMAALRLGMAYASKEIIQILNNIKSPYNINGLVQQEALKALSQHEKVKAWVVSIEKEKTWLEESLNGLTNVVKIYPSDANFLLVKFAKSSELFNNLIAKKVIVRDRSNNYGCENSLRLTIGTRPENEMLVKSIKDFLDSE
ncbi:MAG: histidinol-phosphate aminotransferase [Cyclobacteriaceae bacterium]|jgi:histidinol-phosphate aminotransferase